MSDLSDALAPNKLGNYSASQIDYADKNPDYYDGKRRVASCVYAFNVVRDAYCVWRKALCEIAATYYLVHTTYYLISLAHFWAA